MICKRCIKNRPTTRYVEVIDGQVVERHLCSECLAKLEQDPTQGFVLQGSPTKSTRGSATDIADEAVRMHRSCTNCGMVLGDALESGRVGCAACYEAFGEHLDPFLKDLHRTLQHKGKLGRGTDTRSQLRSDLQAKRAMLRSVLRAENYEEAAKLRDEIRRLESGLYASQAGAD